MTSIPAARWAGPQDTLRDIHYAGFEHWLNDNYDMASSTIFGLHIQWDDACESDDLFDDYIDHVDRTRDV
jgi:hypothetical protein